MKNFPCKARSLVQGWIRNSPRYKFLYYDMVLAVGLSQYTLSVFHLVNHAYFKALLFLSAGAVIHSFSDE